MTEEEKKLQTPGAEPETPPAKTGESDPKEPNWLPERLDRAKRSAVSDLLKDLGVENADALKKTLADWKAHQDSQKSDLDKAKEQLTTAQAELTQLRAAAMRAKAAAKYKLPDALAGRLVGDTEEAIDADAKALADTLPKGAGGNPGNPSPGNPAGEVALTKEAMAAMTPEQINANWDQVQKALAASGK